MQVWSQLLQEESPALLGVPPPASAQHPLGAVACGRPCYALNTRWHRDGIAMARPRPPQQPRIALLQPYLGVVATTHTHNSGSPRLPAAPAYQHTSGKPSTHAWRGASHCSTFALSVPRPNRSLTTSRQALSRHASNACVSAAALARTA